MFDQAPDNLPVAPTAGPAPQPPLEMTPPPRPSASVPKPAPSIPPAGQGFVAPRKQEPEDMFGDLDKGMGDAEGASASLPEAPRGGGTGMRMALIIIGSLVALGALAAGGYFVYTRFIAAPTTPATFTPDAGTPTTEDFGSPDVAPFSPDTTPEPAPEDVLPTEEMPPAVEPTPPPANIPLPEPVGQPEADTDGDGLTDTREQAIATDPMIADTDGDGLSDGEEASVYQTDPLKPDTDGDGLTDGDEVRTWKTDPLNMDTDGDAYTDGSEVQNNYNPNGPGKLPAP